MNNTEIEAIILETLQDLQAGTGEPICEMTCETVPLLELGFFDSLLAIETTLVLEERVGCSTGEDSIFKDREKSEALSIAAIAAKLAKTSAVAG